jgi:hypothetical protein
VDYTAVYSGGCVAGGKAAVGVGFSKLCTGTFFAIANLRRIATISIRVDEDVLDYFKEEKRA